jgi:hypothetical protein
LLSATLFCTFTNLSSSGLIPGSFFGGVYIPASLPGSFRGARCGAEV